MSWMIGVDTGGTFTDVIGLDRGTGELRTVKVPSTPRDPSEAIVNGVGELIQLKGDFSASDISFFAHGTTVATNAVIERKGACTGLLITAGTNAVYVSRQSRQSSGRDQADQDFQKPAPLASPAFTCEIGERLDFEGKVLRPFDREATREQVRELIERKGVTSIAVCYLFSFMNDAHERATLDLIREEFPDVRVSLSSSLVPIIREYRRLSTTVLDAFVGPTLDGYLQRLSAGLNRIGLTTPQLFIMQSNGGLMNIDVASANPVQTLLSGPAAGVISGKYLSTITQFPNLVTFDVGGTSTDVATIVDGEIPETTDGNVAGHDTSVPMSEIGTIGAGGGTIARIGGDGRLSVGPDSAGADPGPVCYGIGGNEPTVTDAALVLGYLDDSAFLKGRVKLDRVRAASAIDEKIARPLGLTVEQAALGIIKIINSHMEGETRLRLMARGYNPSSFALVALGGGGPVHAAMVAENLGFRAVLVPPYPGLGSAMGLLLTDIRHTYRQSRPGVFAGYAPAAMEHLFDELIAKSHAEAKAEGTPVDALRIERFLELRYEGQGYELSVPCPASRLDDVQKATVTSAFHQLHETLYGHCAVDTPIEVVSARVDSSAALPKLQLPVIAAREGAALAPRTRRKVFFDEQSGWLETPVYDRVALCAGDTLAGPAIVEQLDTTTLLLPRHKLVVDPSANLIITFS